MGGAATTFLVARFLTPDYLVQGQDNALSCPLWRGDALVAPTQAGSTVSIYDASNTAIVSAAAVTVTGGIATYTVPAASVPSSLARGMGWRVEWSLIVAGATTPFRNSAGLVRSTLSPVIADGDLFRRVSGLNPAGSAPLSNVSNYQDFRDEAWVKLHGQLVNKGTLPHLVMEPTSLRELHLLLTLSLIFEDFRTRLESATWADQAREYREQYQKAWDELRFEYDTTDSGQSDGRRRRAARPTVWLCGID